MYNELSHGALKEYRGIVKFLPRATKKIGPGRGNKRNYAVMLRV